MGLAARGEIHCGGILLGKPAPLANRTLGQRERFCLTGVMTRPKQRRGNGAAAAASVVATEFSTMSTSGGRVGEFIDSVLTTEPPSLKPRGRAHVRCSPPAPPSGGGRSPPEPGQPKGRQAAMELAAVGTRVYPILGGFSTSTYNSASIWRHSAGCG